MQNKNYVRMTKKRYKEFIDENTKEEGIYEWNVGWRSGKGHSTLLRRNSDKTLELIDQQIDYKADLDYWISEAETKLTNEIRGIMRVDNALFNVKYYDIVYKVNK